MTVFLNKTEILHRAHEVVKNYSEARYEMGDVKNFIRCPAHDYPLQPSPHRSFNGRSLKALYVAVRDGGE
jgi:hypothetical protein